ncbi:MAG: hydrogenase expression/formation C-terminal domain-containing protein [Alphaproteobacteria bacterium]
MSGFKNPMMWNDEEEADVISPIVKEGSSDDPLGIGATSSRLNTQEHIDFESLKSAEITIFLQKICAALRDGIYQYFDLEFLSEPQKQGLYNLLGEGEVEVYQKDGEELKAYETRFVGLWVVKDNQGDSLEVADFPQKIKQYIQEHTRDELNFSKVMPADCMNIQGIFAEIEQKYKERLQEEGNYIINFSLFPMNTKDAQFLAQNLGHIGLKIISKGYSEAIIRPTFITDIYSLQYQNNMGKIILDTIEIGHLPDAVLATREDFRASSQRLLNIIEVYE